MKKRVFLILFLIFLILTGLGFTLLSSPNPSFVSHAHFMENVDAEYGLQRDFSDKKSLLRQRQTLLPHLRRQYVRFSYSVPRDLHERQYLLQQPSNSLIQLKTDAEETQFRLTSFLNDFKKSYEEIRLIIPPTKQPDSIQRLLVTRWEGDASKITDYARATIAFSTLEKMYQGLEQIKKSGLMILSINDHFQSPCLGGYRDITIVFRDFVNGHVGEIQLSTFKMMDFKAGLGTALFHIIRELMAIPVVENRPLSESERICLETLFVIEKKGYDLALQETSKEKWKNSEKKVAIYSGSFDPPTKAHKEIILSALNLAKIDLLIVYVNQFGKKNYSASAEDRKAMLELMLADYREKVSISIQNQKDKRTDFRKLRGLHSHLSLIIGEDSYQKRLNLPPIQLAECDKVLIIPRGTHSSLVLEPQSPDVEVLELKHISSISSTHARTKLFNGELPDSELEPDVLGYILANSLYKEEKKESHAKR